MSPAAELRPYGNNYEHLEDELRWLDLLIRLRTRTLELQNQAAPETQTSRAAYITPAEVEWLLDKSGVSRGDDAAATALRVELEGLRAEIDGRIARSLEGGVFLALPQLAHLFGLSAFEREAIVICLAPELRRKYDRLYAYLQDDITRKRPSVDLVLELLCDTQAQRWNARRVLSDSATLLRGGLLRKVEDPHSPSGASGLAQFLALDPRICEFLLGSSQIDARLAGQTQFYRPTVDADPVPVDPSITAGVWNLVEHRLSPDSTDKRKLVLHLHGPHGVGKRELALHVCRRLNSFLLSIDAELLLARGSEAQSLLRLAFREGLVQQAFLYVEHADALLPEGARPLLNALQVAVSEYGWLVFLSGEGPWTHKQAFSGCRFHSAALPVPDVPLRAAVWERCLAGQASEAAAGAAQLAAQFRLTPGQIQTAARLAKNRCLMEAERRVLTVADLAAACREQSNHKLRELAVQITPHYRWEDLVLPEDKLAHLREICNQVRYHYKVFGTWGFGKKLGYGKGLSALFTGPSGTGKTMAADVLAHELELGLYKVDLSGVVSKYIGETEKNLSRIFAEAETSNAILFFDEADALFGKRTEVSDAHDRYANIETSFLLQKMEEYEGVVIMATNLSENMDEAFTRRIRFIVEFPFPDEAHCLRIWQTHFPDGAPVSTAIDYAYLARELRLSGGNIKNIVLNAAFLAAENGGVVGMEHILHGSRREYQKMGKLWHERPPAPAGPK
jgi:ATP-dependent 26S proteasome regulatory subunit